MVASSFLLESVKSESKWSTEDHLVPADVLWDFNYESVVTT